MTQTNRQWRLAARPQGAIRETDFVRAETPVPEPDEGEFLVRVTHLSFDPTQRGWMSTDTYVPAVALGELMRAKAVGEIVRSRNAAFPVGRLALGAFGWQDFAVSDGMDDLGPVTLLAPHVSPEQALGVLGLTGMTAWFGLKAIGRPRPSETVLVTAAAGATGSIAIQLAKAWGCRTIGVAGGPEKCAWVRDVAGADACLDYRRQNVWRELRTLAPDGVDVIFENVGGKVLEAGIMSLAQGGRIALCGTISTYNDDPHAQPGVRYLLNLCMKRARIEGFLVFDFVDLFHEAVAGLSALMADGRLTNAIDLQDGFNAIPSTLIRLFEGRNIGKQLLKLDDPMPPGL
jgi:NADPH-dependent curcumin reductase CurA